MDKLQAQRKWPNYFSVVDREPLQKFLSIKMQLIMFSSRENWDLSVTKTNQTFSEKSLHGNNPPTNTDQYNLLTLDFHTAISYMSGSCMTNKPVDLKSNKLVLMAVQYNQQQIMMIVYSFDSILTPFSGLLYSSANIMLF